MTNEPSLAETVLILAPTANDGPFAAQVLADSGIQALACPDVESLCAKMLQGSGAVIISEEALGPESIALLRATLDQQPTWSDLPMVLLTNADVVRATAIFSKAGNIALLERPFSRLTLIRSAEVALRSRNKQYELRDLVAALQFAKEEAERANSAKTEFLANMSHEIRTPIGAIVGFIDLMKNTAADSAERAQYTSIIDRNSQQLLRLIDDILDLSKVESGKMTIEEINFNLTDFLSDFKSSWQWRAQEKGLEFSMRFETPMPDQIASDPVRLRQILNNIVGNAIKFTEAGSIEMNVAYKGTTLRFRVKDSGIGLSAEQSEKLFRPFAQADSSTTRKYGGTGLGLVLSRRLAEALKGRLELELSVPGEGSIFIAEIETIRAPGSIWLNAEDYPLRAKEKKAAGSKRPLEGLKVLLIEDSPDNQMLFDIYLRPTGALVTFASDGREGSDAALASNFDVVLMDVQMPVMDGHAATRRLRQMDYAKPIIALTAHAMQEEKTRCLESGFNDYLTKPIERETLIATLSRYL